MSEHAGKPFHANGQTHIGRRKHNEDCVLLEPDLGLMVVADGVGGQDAGEVASALTCEVIVRDIAAGVGLEQSIRNANEEVAAAVAQGRGRQGMASTVVAMHIQNGHYELAWVGDSRGYLWNGDELQLLTRDHSFVEKLLERGKITPEEAKVHPQRNTIVQAIGLMKNEGLEVGLNRGSLKPGQNLLLCSDGLSDVLDSAVIAAILSVDSSIEERCSELINRAVTAGGKDNITALLLGTDVGFTASGEINPDIVWSFNPSTGEYSGVVYGASGTEPLKVKKVAPKAPELSTTMMMSSAEVMEALNQAEQEELRPAKRPLRRGVLWFTQGAVALLAVFLYWIYRG